MTGIKKLRAVYVINAKDEATKTVRLWRGMRNLDVGDKFLANNTGGTEVQPRCSRDAAEMQPTCSAPLRSSAESAEGRGDSTRGRCRARRWRPCPPRRICRSLCITG